MENKMNRKKRREEDEEEEEEWKAQVSSARDNLLI